MAFGKIPRFSPSFSTAEALTAARYLARDGDDAAVVESFERAFADMIGSEHAVMVPSARYGFHLLLDGWGIGPQDEVIVTGGEFGELDLEQFCTDEMSIAELPVSELSVYPNPASDLISIEGIGAGAIVRAFDVTGRSIAAEQMRSDNARISTASWPRGWAILRVEWNDQVRTARVLLK